jgi:branched-chain amino acid transport system substrate-binding protein
MNRTFMGALLAIMLTSALMPGCKNDDESPQIVIGAILPLTGDYEYFGLVVKEVFELGLQEAGKDIKVVYEDSAGESEKAITAFDKLVNEDRATVIVTVASWISNSVYPLAADNGIVQATLASTTFQRTLDTDKAVSFTAPIMDEAERLSEYLQDFNRIGVIYQNNDYGRDWDAQLRDALPGRVVASESYDVALEAPFISTDQIQQDLLNINSERPDVLVCLSIGKQAALIAGEAYDMGLNLPLVGTRPIATPELLAGGEAVEGLVFTYPSYDTRHPIVQKYETNYNKKFTVNGAEAYDCFMTLLQAVREYGVDPSDIYNWYSNREYDGALGHIAFDTKARAHYGFILQEVNNGEFLPLN